MSQVNNIFTGKCQYSNEDSVFLRCHLGSGPRRPGVQHPELRPQRVPAQVPVLWALRAGGSQGETWGDTMSDHDGYIVAENERGWEVLLGVHLVPGNIVNIKDWRKGSQNPPYPYPFLGHRRLIFTIIVIIIIMTGSWVCGGRVQLPGLRGGQVASHQQVQLLWHRGEWNSCEFLHNIWDKRILIIFLEIFQMFLTRLEDKKGSFKAWHCNSTSDDD